MNDIKIHSIDNLNADNRNLNNKSSVLLSINNLSKKYNTTAVFDEIDFDIYQNEFICLIGHSGCGKSTILNALAGLECPSGGTMTMSGAPIVAPSLARGVVFQGHALLPWLSVGDNLAFALRAKYPKMSKDEMVQKINHYLVQVGLDGAANKPTHALSGGQKQRVGIARAFAINPQLLLMDEPFGALDALTRGRIQDILVQMLTATRQTVFMITHDIDEAILLADRIFLMSSNTDGHLDGSTNGKTAAKAGARLSQIVINPIKNRRRDTLHHARHYQALRTHLLDFLTIGHTEKGATKTVYFDEPEYVL